MGDDHKGPKNTQALGQPILGDAPRHGGRGGVERHCEAQPLDLYLDGTLLAGDLGFWEATACFSLVSGVDHVLDVCPGDSVDNSNPYLSRTLNTGEMERILKLRVIIGTIDNKLIYAKLAACMGQFSAKKCLIILRQRFHPCFNILVIVCHIICKRTI